MSEYDFNTSPAHRRVRSFVTRAGRLTDAQARALNDFWPQYGIDFQQGALDWHAVFGREAPRLLEIGFGAGEALLAFARNHPEMDCLGIDVHRPGIGRLLLEAAASKIENVRVICHDAVEVLSQQISAESLTQVHIFFPDPWPKKRHRKRRLVQAPFVELLARTIKPGGVLRLATDWEDYAHSMRTVLDASAAFRSLSNSGGFVERAPERPTTRFERRGQRLGHQVWDLAYEKQKSSCLK